jgi:hypothetical protein
MWKQCKCSKFCYRDHGHSWLMLEKWEGSDKFRKRLTDWVRVKIPWISWPWAEMFFWPETTALKNVVYAWEACIRVIQIHIRGARLVTHNVDSFKSLISMISTADWDHLEYSAASNRCWHQGMQLPTCFAISHFYKNEDAAMSVSNVRDRGLKPQPDAVHPTLFS